MSTSHNTPQYENEETAQKLEQARKELERREQADEAKQAAETYETRQEIADEEQPHEDAPELRETYTVEFRGHPFEFFELGDAAIKAARFSQQAEEGDEEDAIEAGSQAADFVYETLGEKSVSDAVDESYWRRYDFDDIMGLFFDLADESTEIDEEEREKIDEFRNQ